MDLGLLRAHDSRDNRFRPLPGLPEADFDLSVVVADDVAWAAVAAAATRAEPLVDAVSYLAEYRGDWVPDGYRSLTLRVTLRPSEATLTADRIGAARARVLAALGDAVNAKLR